MSRLPRALLAALLAALVTAAALPAAAPAAAVGTGPEGRYVVALRDGVGDVPGLASRLTGAHGGRLRAVWDRGLTGFSARLSAAQAAALARDPRVLAVEPDHLFRASVEVPNGVARIEALENATASIDGFDERVDADVAILDSGIDGSHPDLDVAGAVDCSSGSCVPVAVPVDLNGHGTHVAGTVGALDDEQGVVGVAPGARLWSVRVLDQEGNGRLEAVVAGLNWVTENAARVEVANASFGCECASLVLDAAIDRLTDAGGTLVVASGNEGQDAAGVSPANNPKVISVSAFADLDGRPGAMSSRTCQGLPDDTDDRFASFSNFGNVVDLAAPGVCIASTIPVSMGSYGLSSGTSMAAPHVTAAAALYIAERQVPRSGSRWSVVRAGLIDDWSASQDGTCGFAGGLSPERALNLTRCGEQVEAKGDPIAAACPSGSVPPSGFDDVASDNAHARAIDCVVWWEVARGTSASTYSPGRAVTRAQMASFIAALVLRSQGTLPTTGEDFFDDDDGSPHEANINRLAAAGIVRGVGPRTYAPGATVTRGQMATFLVAAYEYRTDAELPPGEDRFSDDDGSPHEANIDKAAEAGFTSGRTADRYDPASPVRRDQMATFLARTLDKLVADGWTPLPE